MFDALIVFGDKGFGSDNPGIREVSRPILKPSYSVHIEFIGALFFENLFIDHARSAFNWPGNRPRFVHMPAISPQTHLFVPPPELDQPEIKGKKAVLIILLTMIPE